MLCPNFGGGSGMSLSQDMSSASRGLPDGSNLGLGLQSLSLSSWDRPSSSQETDMHTTVSSQAHSSSPTVLGLFNIPLGNILRKPLCYHPSEAMGTPASHLDSRSFLDSRSSSPADSKTSGFSSGSALSTLRISPPSPYLMSSMQKEPLRLSSRLEHQDSCSPLTSPSSTSPGSASSHRWPTGSLGPGLDLLNQPDESCSIEREARLHRQAAAVSEARFTWTGQLPPRNNKDPLFSCKVFLGGIPWDITEAGLINTFSGYGPLSVEWPGEDGMPPRCLHKGYVYLVFEKEKSVKALLQACTQELLPPEDKGEYYVKMSSRRMRLKDALESSRLTTNTVISKLYALHLLK